MNDKEVLGMPRGGKFRKNRGGRDYQQRLMARNMDLLAEFDRFKDEVLPALRADLKNGLTAEEIYSKYQHLVAARSVTLAMTEVDTSKALSAIKDILDRSQGKAKERQEVTHKMSKVSDDELDAMLMSKVKEAGIDVEESGDEEGGSGQLQ